MARRKIQREEKVTFEKEGQSVTGKLIEISTYEFPRDNGVASVGRYVLANEDGRGVVLGTSELDSMMAQVTMGETIEIKYTHASTTGSGRPFKHWEVTVIEEEPEEAK